MEMETGTLETTEEQLQDTGDKELQANAQAVGGEKATEGESKTAEESKVPATEGEPKKAIDDKKVPETKPVVKPQPTLEELQAALEASEQRTRKVQASLQAKVNAAAKTSRLEAAARESRRKLDPMAESYQEDTPEEKALAKHLKEVEKYEATESQEEGRAQVFQRVATNTAVEIQEMIAEAGVDIGDADTNPKLKESADLLLKGDFKGAKKAALAAIREGVSTTTSKKATADFEARVQAEADKRVQAELEKHGLFVTNTAGSIGGGGASELEGKTPAQLWAIAQEEKAKRK